MCFVESRTARTPAEARWKIARDMAWQQWAKDLHLDVLFKKILDADPESRGEAITEEDRARVKEAEKRMQKLKTANARAAQKLKKAGHGGDDGAGPSGSRKRAKQD